MEIKSKNNNNKEFVPATNIHEYSTEDAGMCTGFPSSAHVVDCAT